MYCHKRKKAFFSFTFLPSWYNNILRYYQNETKCIKPKSAIEKHYHHFLYTKEGIFFLEHFLQNILCNGTSLTQRNFNLCSTRDILKIFWHYFSLFRFVLHFVIIEITSRLVKSITTERRYFFPSGKCNSNTFIWWAYDNNKLIIK